MKFIQLVNLCDKLEKTSSRLEMNAFFSEFLAELKKEDSRTIKIVAYLLLGAVGPSFVNLKFNVSDKTVEQILSEFFGAKAFLDASERIGDLGDVFRELSEPTKPSDTTVSSVYETLLSLARSIGAGSNSQKKLIIRGLLSLFSPEEGKYFIRMVLGDLRIGFNEKTFLESISVFLKGDKSISKFLVRKYGLYPDIGEILLAVLKYEGDGIDKIKIHPGVPVLPKLVQRESGFLEILNRFNPMVLQPKYDGVRAQIHYGSSVTEINKPVWQSNTKTANAQSSMFAVKKDNFPVKIFTRNLEDLTEMFPEITTELDKLSAEVKNFIIDAEIVSLDEKGNFKPFQDTMKRKRKYGIAEASENFPVKVFIFDIIFFNDEDLTPKSLNQRFEVLERLVELFKKNSADLFRLTPMQYIADVEVAEDFFSACLSDGYEGVIAKDPNSSYEVGTRNYDWIKFKRASAKGLSDSLDLVILGYYLGKGKRTKFGVGAFLTGIYDKKRELFLTVAKVGTGMTDSVLKKLSELLASKKLNKKPQNYVVEKNLEPDFYVTPQIVCVVEADEITLSPVHSSGFALRFPRLKVLDRQDKGPKETTTLEEVERIHELFRNNLKSRK